MSESLAFIRRRKSSRLMELPACSRTSLADPTRGDLRKDANAEGADVEADLKEQVFRRW